MKIRYFFYLALIMYIYGEIGYSYYIEKLDLFDITKKNIFLSVFGLIRDVGLAFCLSGAIIYSFWSYPDSKNKSKAKFAIIACILLNLFFIIISAYSYHIAANNFQKAKTILEDSRFADPEFLEKYEKKISSNDMKLDEKIRYSKIVASIVYKDTGKKINVVNKQNEIVSYEPTAEDKELYSQTKKTIYVMENTLHSLKFAAIFWMSVLILSVIIGFLVMKKRSNKNGLYDATTEISK